MIPPNVAPEATGEGITIGVVDSGINFRHPHLRLPHRGFSVRREDEELIISPGRCDDQYGHGTCVAALVHALAPGAAILSAKVTGRRGTTDADRLALGLTSALQAGADILCVALGTDTQLRAGLDDAVAQVLAAGTVIVAASLSGAAGRAADILPAGCTGVLRAALSPGVDAAFDDDCGWADGQARPANGHETNFAGPSLSAARVAAALARIAQSSGVRGDALVAAFVAAATVSGLSGHGDVL